MALVPTTAANDAQLIAEVAMATDSSAPTVRATVVQASTIFYDTPATLDKAERLLAEAAGFGAQIVVFPEAFVGGYPRGSNYGVSIGNRTPKGKEEFRKYHAAAIDVPGPEVDRLAAMAGKYRVHLVMGVIERDGYTLYCTVLFFDPQGRYLGKHRKLMPTGLERIIWGFGDGSTIPVFETSIGKIGAAICWENRMPLLRTAMYAKGVEIYCAPTADSRDTWQASMAHIALEGGCFVLSANQFCRRKDYPPPPEYVFYGIEEDLTPDSVVCAGGSVIISPSGTILAGPNYDGEALISADLDLGEIVRAKFDFDVVGHYARPEVLSLTVKDHPTTPVTFTSTSAKIEDSCKKYLGEILPELRGESGWRREVGKLCSDALKEEPRQALPVDHRNARRRQPSDQSESDHIQISPQPVSFKASHSPKSTINDQNQQSKSNNDALQIEKRIQFSSTLGSVITYHVNLPPDARATLSGFLAAAGDLTNTRKEDKEEN